jgi:hypothetical protein
MNIYSTFLYIKKHSITGLLYFGKTTKNPEKYYGSGKYWLKHIKKHGKKHVVTLWYCLFLDKDTLTSFALNFSKQNNIVKSDLWANLTEENGLDGGKRYCPNNGGKRIGAGRKLGSIFSDQHKKNISNNNGMNIKCSCVYCKKVISAYLWKRHEKSCTVYSVSEKTVRKLR